MAFKVYCLAAILALFFVVSVLGYSGDIPRPRKLKLRNDFLTLNVDKFAADSVLTKLENYIKTKKLLSKYAFNASASWDFVHATFQTGSNGTIASISLDNITTTIISKGTVEELTVVADVNAWDNTHVDLHMVFVHDVGTTDLKIYINFEADIPAFPSNVTKNTGSKWFNAVRLVGKNTIEAASTDFTDLKGASYKKGLSMTGNFVLGSSFPGYTKLLQLADTTSIKGKYDALFPLLSTSPYATLDLDIVTPLHFKSKSITASNLDLRLVAATHPEVTLSSDIAVAFKDDTVDFHVSADFVAVESIDFKGALTSAWKDAFGLHWLSFNPGATLEFSAPPAKLDFKGEALVSFAKSTPVSASWSVDAASDSLDFELVLSVSVLGMEQLFNDVIGKQPPSANEVGITGEVTITLANYNTGSAQEGLTILGKGVISSTGTIGKALKDITKSPSFDFNFDIFIPVFGQNQAEIQFILTDPSPIKISQDMTMNNAKIRLEILPTPGIDFDADLSVVVKDSASPVTFDISGIIGESQGLDFSGSLESPWKNPFGLKWLTFETLKADLHFETGLSSLSMSGSADMTFGVNADVSITVGPPDFSDFTVTIATTIPNINTFFQDVTGHPGPKMLQESSLQSTITINSETGLTVDGLLSVNIDSPLGHLIKSLNPKVNPLDFVFDIHFFIPLFSQMPATLSFSVQETGKIQYTSNLALNGYTIKFVVLPAPEVSVSTTGDITLRHQTTPIDFSISGDLNSASESFSMSGSVTTPWTHPFDIKWLTVDDVSISFAFSLPGGLTSLSFSMDSELDFAKDTNKLHTSISAENNFMDWQLDVADVTVISLEDALQKLGHKAPSELADTTTITNSIDVGLNSATGLTLSESCTIKGALLKKLEIFHTGMQSETFTLSLGLPIFAPGDVTFGLGLPALRINKYMIFTGLQFSVDTEADISVGAGVKVNFSHNPQLEFDAKGTFNVDGAVSLEGDMVGTWLNMFGIKGFDLSNVEIDVGFNPSLCAVDGCLSALGLGFSITVGSEVIEMYGYAAIPDVWKLFLMSKIDGPHGLALSFRDIASEWNKLVGGHIDINTIPADWGFKDFSFYIAPEAGEYDHQYYAAGFQIAGGLDIIGIDADVNITVTSDDFNFDVHLSVSQFLTALKHELGLLDLNPEELVGVNKVTVSGMTTANIAKNQFPEFYMDYEFFGHHTAKFNFKKTADVADTFHNFFHTYLKKLFG